MLLHHDLSTRPEFPRECRRYEYNPRFVRARLIFETGAAANNRPRFYSFVGFEFRQRRKCVATLRAMPAAQIPHPDASYSRSRPAAYFSLSSSQNGEPLSPKSANHFLINFLRRRTANLSLLGVSIECTVHARSVIETEHLFQDELRYVIIYPRHASA
jgi:hypothetical protein